MKQICRMKFLKYTCLMIISKGEEHYQAFDKHGICAMQESIPLEEVFDNLKCTREGLSSEQVQERLDLFGYNKLEEKKVKSQTSVLLVSYLLIKLLLRILTDSFCKFLLLVQESKILKFLGFMWNPLSWVMEAAALMAIAMAHGGVNLHHF